MQIDLPRVIFLFFFGLGTRQGKGTQNRQRAARKNKSYKEPTKEQLAKRPKTELQKQN